MATDSVADDTSIYLQVTEGAHKLKVRIEELLEKNASLENENVQLKDDLKSLENENVQLKDDLKSLGNDKDRLSDDLKSADTEWSKKYNALNQTHKLVCAQSQKQSKVLDKQLHTLKEEIKQKEQSLQNKTAYYNQQLFQIQQEKDNSYRQTSQTIEHLRASNQSLSRNLQKVNYECDYLVLRQKKNLEQSELNLNQALQSNTQLSNKKAELDCQFQELQRMYHIRVQELEKSANSIEEGNTKASNLELENSQLVKTLNVKEVFLKQETDRLNQAHERAVENEKARYFLLSQNYHQLEEERAGLVLRLSKVTCNCHIADLSDNKRPTKLAEKFSELYDNEWTDAFGKVCVKMEKSEGIQYMLSILRFAFTICNEISTTSMEKSSTAICHTGVVSDENVKSAVKKLQEQLLCSDIVSDESLVCGSVSGDKNSENDPGQSLSGDSVPGRIRIEMDETVKTLRDEFIAELLNMQQKIGFTMTVRVQQELTTVICKRCKISTETGDTLNQYIRKCIELCWYMSLQNPPFYMKFEEPGEDLTFDVNMYKPYEKTGEHNAYIVWPPLFLHKDGSMLSKGIAQGK